MLSSFWNQNGVPHQLASTVLNFLPFIHPTGGGNTRPSLGSQGGSGLPTCLHFIPNTNTSLFKTELVSGLLQARHRSGYLCLLGLLVPVRSLIPTPRGPRPKQDQVE